MDTKDYDKNNMVIGKEKIGMCSSSLYEQRSFTSSLQKNIIYPCIRSKGIHLLLTLLPKYHPTRQPTP